MKRATRLLFGAIKLSSNRTAAAIARINNIPYATSPFSSTPKYKSPIREAMETQQLQEEFDNAMNHRLRPLNDLEYFSALSEERIDRAIKEGEFRNLPGAGKPIPKYETEETGMDPAESVLHAMLAKQNYAPDWVDKRQTIEDTLTKAVASYRRALQQQQQQNGGGKSRAAASGTGGIGSIFSSFLFPSSNAVAGVASVTSPSASAAKAPNALEDFCSEIRKVNLLIRDHNLTAPPSKHIAQLDAKVETDKAATLPPY